jgi:RNA polymerase sigma-70 factor (ECF subfamily)
MNPFVHFCKDRELKSRIAEQRNRLYRIAYSWCHDEALSDDLTQETMTKALKKYHSLKNPDSLNCWLYGILANCWRDHFRRTREHEDIDSCVFTSDITPESEYNRQYITDTILTAVAELPISQRQTLTLVDLEGFSYAEVAEILQTPIGTVMSRLCRARKSLTTQLLNLKTQSRDDQTPFLRRVK